VGGACVCQRCRVAFERRSTPKAFSEARTLVASQRGGLKMSVDPQPFNGIAALAGQERFYKLSVLRSAPLRNPLWCSVKYGPWLVAKETESCFDGVPNKWEFFIVQMPQVAQFWVGEWKDMPAVPSLTVTMGDQGARRIRDALLLRLSVVSHHAQSCLPPNVECQDPIPA